jgi:NAD(P)-dependent dehydrogenase (short-subunit alcohol dehydrogenase family)
MAVSEEVSSLLSLEGRGAIVTGAATGIGREIARLFHAAGAKVIGADINEAELKTLAESSPGLVPIRFDQGDPSSIESLFSQADGQIDRLDVLVNCAAIYPFRPFEEVDTDLIDRMLDINLRGPFQCTQQAVRRMKEGDRGGSIVNIASVNSMRACIFDNIHYGVGKAGVNNLTVSVALEYAQHNIRVNSVLPGGVATEQAGKAVESYGQALRGPFMQPGRMPLRGMSCEPADIARACLFLASDASSYITGQLLAVDGGFLVS